MLLNGECSLIKVEHVGVTLASNYENALKTSFRAWVGKNNYSAIALKGFL